MTGVWFVYEAFRLQRAEGGDQFHDFYERIPVFKYITKHAKKFDSPFFRDREEWDDDGGVNFLDWIGWLWVEVYEPVMNTMWLVSNWSTASGWLKFARAISVGVSALPLTVDTKARYGIVLEKYLGKPFRWFFTLISAVACLYLGLLAVLLLCLALADWHTAVWKPILLAIGYTLVMAFWTLFSFSMQTPHDEGLGVHSFWQFFSGFVIGVFGICFVALPTGVVVLASPNSPGLALNEYVACESVDIWRKAIALLP
jgi:hypothetical protein